MSELGKTKRAGEKKTGHRQVAGKPAGDQPRRKVDLDAVPAGWDAEVWRLALYFERIAEERGFQLAAGRPVLYARLEDRINKSGIRDLNLYGKKLDWPGFVEIMMLDFWDNEVWLATAAHAIDQFCGVEMFGDLRDSFLRELAARQAHKHMTRQPDHHRTPEQQRRVDERVRLREEEAAQARAAATRTRPRRSWEETRAAVKRIRDEREARRAQ